MQRSLDGHATAEPHEEKIEVKRISNQTTYKSDCGKSNESSLKRHLQTNGVSACQSGSATPFQASVQKPSRPSSSSRAWHTSQPKLYQFPHSIPTLHKIIAALSEEAHQPHLVSKCIELFSVY
jgi:hypothetical protein